ncbi:GDP-fucose transporter 1 [Amphibalanus amphitrite]|uniref:GDP-fucose transporter 1 n=1 Tax=Amphibalanus amphitrite TaxID=1232801 RepID=A0A6A4WQD0_AMPAM|nr:GDP-fucose transporter 1 [Amphibalanus amphitrite]
MPDPCAGFLAFLRAPTLLFQYAKIAAVVATYWVVSITMVFANKALLSGQGVSAPFFVTGYQCLVTSAMCFAFSSLGPYVPGVNLPPPTVKPKLMLQVLPLSVVFICMIMFNNLCLKNVDVSFYYIGRSLTTVFNVICTYLILGQKTSFQSIACCGVIIFGFLLGVDQEGVVGSLSIAGVAYGVLASLFVSLFAIYTKKVLPVVDGSVWLLTYYNNINACLLFTPLVLITGEWSQLMAFQGLADPKFWTLMTVAGVFGFSIGYVTGLQIQVTSPLTHNISGTAKACVQTVLGSWWFSEYRTVLWWTSNFIVLGGSAAYTRVKQIEMEAKHRASLSV